MPRNTSRAMIGAVLLGAMIVPGSLAQEGRDILRIRRLEANTVQTPAVQMRVDRPAPARRGRPGNWLQVACEFETRPEWIDELEFTYYVLLRSDNPERPFRLLTERVTYVNIPRDRFHYSWLYVHPDALKRFGSFEGAAVEIRSQNRPVAGEATAPNYRQWVDQLPAETGLLLTPEKTPFMLYAPDFNLMIKPN